MPQSLHIFYRRSPNRIEASRKPGSPAFSELLPGCSLLQEQGWTVRHNLETQPGRISHQIGDRIARHLNRKGLFGGDLPSVLSSLPQAHQADVLWSTVDTLGLPLARLKQRGLLRRPLLYTSIGLPERLAQLNSAAYRAKLLHSLARCERFICYGWEEAERLRDFLPGRTADIHFLPYSVDTDFWQPLSLQPDVDILSIGMDPQRDFALLREYARAHPQHRLRILSHPDTASRLAPLPPNLECLPPMPLEDIPRQMALARVIALPVLNNSYSGATTTLLQALAMAKPVVVTETAAIREGYDLRAARACLLAPPGDPDAFFEALNQLLADSRLADQLSRDGLQHVQQHLNRVQWAEAIQKHLLAMVSPAIPPEGFHSARR